MTLNMLDLHPNRSQIPYYISNPSCLEEIKYFCKYPHSAAVMEKDSRVMALAKFRAAGQQSCTESRSGRLGESGWSLSSLVFLQEGTRPSLLSSPWESRRIDVTTLSNTPARWLKSESRASKETPRTSFHCQICVSPRMTVDSHNPWAFPYDPPELIMIIKSSKSVCNTRHFFKTVLN